MNYARQCVVLAACGTIEQVVRAFFARKRWWSSIVQAGHPWQSHDSPRPFEFDPDEELIVARGLNDPGVYEQAHDLLRAYSASHEHAIVVLDREYGTVRTAETTRVHIEGKLSANGWSAARVKVIVIDPEVERWIWMDNMIVADAFGFPSPQVMQAWLRDHAFEIDEQGKPIRPKEAAEKACRANRTVFSSAVHGQIIAAARLRDCTDQAFHALRDALLTWYAPESPV